MLPATTAPRLDPLPSRRQALLREKLNLGLVPEVGGEDPQFLYRDFQDLGLARRKSKPNRNSYYADDQVTWWVYTGTKPWFDAEQRKVIQNGDTFGYAE